MDATSPSDEATGLDEVPDDLCAFFYPRIATHFSNGTANWDAAENSSKSNRIELCPTLEIRRV